MRTTSRTKATDKRRKVFGYFSLKKVFRELGHKIMNQYLFLGIEKIMQKLMIDTYKELPPHRFEENRSFK
jgi:hypothetical protein